MKRFKAFSASMALVLLTSSQALADREGYSDDGDGAGILFLIVVIFFGLLVVGGLASSSN